LSRGAGIELSDTYPFLVIFVGSGVAGGPPWKREEEGRGEGKGERKEDIMVGLKRTNPDSRLVMPD